MRLDINLASRPYEDARQFWMRWGTAVGALGLLTLILMTLVITGFVNARRDRQAISEKRALIAQRDQLRTQAQQFLNRPENRTTRDDSRFLNQLIERKAFSWTKVLESLERVMPPRVHVVSISPELNEAAAIDGAKPWQRFWYVTWPLLLPVTMVVVLFSVIQTFADFQIVYVMTGGGPANATHLFATYAYQIGIGTGLLSEGAAISLAMFPILFLVVIIQLLYIRRVEVR